MGGFWRAAAVLAVLVLLPLLGTGSASAALAASTTTGSVHVVHGVPGTTVDVLVDGAVVAPGVAAGTIAGPLTLTPGTHSLELRSGSTSVAQASFVVQAGASLDLVAHLRADAAEAPVVTAFPNDVTPVAPGKARLVVSHTAAVPPVNLVVDGTVLASNVANGESWTGLVPATTLSLQAVPAATAGDPVVGPADVDVKAGTLTRVFVIGMAGTVATIVQSLDVPVSGAAAPSSVQTGDGGQAAAGLLDDPAALGALGAGALALALGATAGFGRRSRRPVAVRPVVAGRPRR